MSLRVRGCEDCLRKQIKIDELQAKIAALRKENARLRKQLGKQHRTVDEVPFGANTPSSKQLLKPGATEENRRKRGGARPGHQGHGRPAPKLGEDARQITLPPGPCPYCGGEGEVVVSRPRGVKDARPLTTEESTCHVPECRCRRCRRWYHPTIPGVLPKARYSNALLSTVAVEHYLHGATMGSLMERLGISSGSLYYAMHRLADLLAAAPEALLAELRQAPRKHGDETVWRTDGRNGYNWFFGNERIRIFLFRDTRSGDVVREALGAESIPGVLNVDRYGGYNVAPCARQFCYAHLLRDLEDLGKEFPDNPEVAAFVDRLAPLLAEAMHLQAFAGDDDEYYRRAKELKADILAAVEASARHPGVQAYQNIFRQNPDKLYHWADDRRIPADNNFAERAIRRSVIARKVSYGSQSERGARTREILMTVLFTLALRVPDPYEMLRAGLDRLALAPDFDLVGFLFPSPAAVPAEAVLGDAASDLARPLDRAAPSLPPRPPELAEVKLLDSS